MWRVRVSHSLSFFSFFTSLSSSPCVQVIHIHVPVRMCLGRKCYSHCKYEKQYGPRKIQGSVMGTRKGCQRERRKEAGQGEIMALNCGDCVPIAWLTCGPSNTRRKSRSHGRFIGIWYSPTGVFRRLTRVYE